MSGSPPPVALTIAGFDPSSGAGVTADLKTFSAHGVYGVACLTALTVQSTQGVWRVEQLSPTLVGETLACLAEDVEIAGIKIGMLGSAGVILEVASFLKTTKIRKDRIVLDPVLRSSSGAALVEEEGVRVICEAILPEVGWVTPNRYELAVLGGEGPPSVAAARLRTRGNPELNVVVTGGDLVQPDEFVLTATGAQHWLAGEKIETNATHGTGCAFSSALLCALMDGRSPVEAVWSAKNYVTEALRSAYPMGKGKGPINHLYTMLLSK